MSSINICKFLQAISLIFCIAALVIGGLTNPMIGFPIAIMIMIGLEIITPKMEIPSEKVLKMAYGSIRSGGIRRGIFIREMFCSAIIIAFIWNFSQGRVTFSYIYGALAIALIISSISSEIEAYTFKKAILNTAAIG